MRLETRSPPGSSRVPAAAAIVFMGLMVASIWWDSRKDSNPPATPTATVPAPAAVKPVAKAVPKVQPELAQVKALEDFAQKELPEESPAARASTAEGMRLLAAAIAARGDSLLWRDRAKRLQEAADKVEKSADSTAAADVAHEALIQAAEWIAGLPRQGAADPGSPDAVLAAAKAIKEDQPLRTQSQQLEQYFDAAARAL